MPSLRGRQVQVLFLTAISSLSILFLLTTTIPPDHHNHPNQAITRAQEYVKQQTSWFSSSTIPCDSNKQPGYPSPKDFHWETPNPECPGYPFPTRNTRKDALWDDFPEFRNKTMLLAGDSVGRHLAETICNFYFNQPIKNENPPDFNYHYGWSGSCHVPELDFNVYMIHIYGMANTSDPEVNKILDKTYSGKDWDLQSRTHRYLNSTMKGVVPDYVQLNSGAWEYRYWFVRDILAGNRHDDMPIEDRETNARMAIQSMDFFQSLWPKAQVWYLHMSMMNEDDVLVKQAHGKAFLKDKTKVDDPNAYPPMYSWRRQAQYRATMRTMIDQAGYDSLDYAQVQQVMSRSQFSKENDVIHPQDLAKRTMASMMLAKVKRHYLYGV